MWLKRVESIHAELDDQTLPHGKRLGDRDVFAEKLGTSIGVQAHIANGIQAGIYKNACASVGEQVGRLRV